MIITIFTHHHRDHCLLTTHKTKLKANTPVRASKANDSPEHEHCDCSSRLLHTNLWHQSP